MKRLTVVSFVLLMIFVSCFSVAADESLYVSASNETIKNNRLFEIDVYASGVQSLSGGELLLTYDSSIAQYRDVKSDTFDVEAKAEDGKIKVVFATADTLTLNGDTKLFSISFKSVSNGSFDIDMLSCECLSSELEKLSIQFVTGTVTVSQNTVKTTKSDKNKDSANSAEAFTVTSASADENNHIFLDAISGKNKPIFYAVLTVLAVVILFVLGVIFGRKTSSKEKQDEAKSESEK